MWRTNRWSRLDDINPMATECDVALVIGRQRHHLKAGSLAREDRSTGRHAHHQRRSSPARGGGQTIARGGLRRGRQRCVLHGQDHDAVRGCQDNDGAIEQGTSREFMMHLESHQRGPIKELEKVTQFDIKASESITAWARCRWGQMVDVHVMRRLINPCFGCG